MEREHFQDKDHKYLQEIEELRGLWKQSVFDMSSDIDSNNEYCWRSLAMGWALGQGLSVKDAEAFINGNPHL